MAIANDSAQFMMKVRRTVCQRVAMKPENQIWAGFLLLVHALFIAMAIGVAYFTPYESRIPTVTFRIQVHSFLERLVSIEQLETLNTFLDSGDQWAQLGIDDLRLFLDEKPNLTKLDFFSGVETSQQAEFLADRVNIFLNPDRELGNCCTLQASIANATQQDSATILNNIVSLLEDHLEQKLPRLRGSEIQVSLRNLGIDDPRDTDELTPKLPPGIVALLAAISVTIAWTIWSPRSNRTIPFVISICQFVIVILGFAVFGGLLGTVINTFGNKQSVSECSIQVLRKPVVTEYAMPLGKRELVRKIHDKTNSCDYAKILKTDTLIASLISHQNLLNWPSFRIIVDDETIDEETSARPVTPVDDDVEQQLIDYIQQHLEVEADPDSPEIVTVRFRCRYRLDASTFLANLVRKQISNLDLENEQVRQLASRGASLATETTAINWLSWPNSKPERWYGFDWQIFLQTANLGAISAIVFLSSIRVLAGVPPI